jgi:hypothetical protein
MAEGPDVGSSRRLDWLDCFCGEGLSGGDVFGLGGAEDAAWIVDVRRARKERRIFMVDDDLERRRVRNEKI